MKTFIEGLNFRHACKSFDPHRTIPSVDFDQILGFGRLSPSSFGMEPWRFKVIETHAIRAKLREACWNQPQIEEASHVVVICAITEDIKLGADYVSRLFQRRNLPEEATTAYLARYKSHFEVEIYPRMTAYAWSAKQCYIALANMMTGAASLGIDSCPIEGFAKDEVERLLEINTAKEEVAVIVTFGYRAGEQTPRLRQDRDELVTFY